jgi:hypothetical protein
MTCLVGRLLNVTLAEYREVATGYPHPVWPSRFGGFEACWPQA